MIEDFIYQVLLVVLIVSLLIDLGRLHKKLKAVEERLDYIYSLLYYQHYGTYYAAQSREEPEERAEDAADADPDRVKEACVVELVSRRGCVAMEEVVMLCNVSKSFIVNRLYRKRKVVKVDREYKTVCPK